MGRAPRHTDTQPDALTDSVAYAVTHAFADSEPDSFTHTQSDPFADSLTLADAVSYAEPHPFTYT